MPPMDTKETVMSHFSSTVPAAQQQILPSFSESTWRHEVSGTSPHVICVCYVYRWVSCTRREFTHNSMFSIITADKHCHT